MLPPLEGVWPLNPQRFALEEFNDGGVLLDAQGGSLFRLNRAATAIWSSALVSTPLSSIANALVDAHDLPFPRAYRDVVETLTLPSILDLHPPVGEMTYLSTSTGYVFSMNGRPAVDIDVRHQTVHFHSGVAIDDYGVCLRAIAPKLVASKGPSVLHAAAVATQTKKIWAFMGSSGAGKTTTARAFADTGLTAVCEDKLVAINAQGRLAGLAEGENKINRWIRQTRQSLELNPNLAVNTAALAECSRGEALAIDRIFLLDVNRRSGTQIELTELTPTQAASELFQHAFYGSALEQDWRLQLSSVACLARTSRVFAATVPSGLAQLGEAARTYIEMTAE